MLSYKRALVVALALLTLFFLLRHSDTTTSRHMMADQLPRPDSVKAKPSPLESMKETIGKGKTEESSWFSSSRQKAPSKKPTQISMKELEMKPLREQLEYQFPYDPQSKFPGYIWQTWKRSPADETFEFGEFTKSWTEMHPTFVHEVITDKVAVHLLRHLYASVPSVMDAYHALPIPVLKADFFRYLILLARGGIYSDIDTSSIKPATEWVPANVPRSSFGMVIGIEADPDRPDWAEWYSRRIQFCQWTIQSKPGHPILREIVANITEETLARKAQNKLHIDHTKIIDFTGPAVWTDVIFEYFNDPEIFDMSTSKGNITWEHFTGMKAAKKMGDVIVLPITSFSPGVQQMGAGEDDDEMAFVKHNFEGSWKPEELRHIGEQQEDHKASP